MPKTQAEREANRRYRQTAKGKAATKRAKDKYRATANGRAVESVWRVVNHTRNRETRNAYSREYGKAYNQRPGVKERDREVYYPRKRTKALARHRKRWADPLVRAMKAEYDRKRRQRMKEGKWQPRHKATAS